jgi:L-fuculose-phosphate aldolase
MSRLEIIRFSKKLVESGLVTGTSGNVSIRDPKEDWMWITPSAVPYEQMIEMDLVAIDLTTGAKQAGRREPSSETPMHRAIYLENPGIRAIIHTHSPYATMFASAGKEIPALHYLVADLGDCVPIAPYAIFGTEALGRQVTSALQKANGALLEHHGVVAVGETLADAYRRAELIEYLAKVSFGALLLGAEKQLTNDQLAEIRSKIGNYFSKS